MTPGCGSPVVRVSDHVWYVMSWSPIPIKIRRVGERCTLNLWRAETSIRWWGTSDASYTGTRIPSNGIHPILFHAGSSDHPLRVLSLTSTHGRFHLEWCRAQGNWTAVKLNQVVLSDESRFNLSSDGNHVRAWRPCGEHLNPAFGLQRHTAPTDGLMVWSVIAYNTR
ncbi:transposable element Tcb2 transposase [Trichonephila clavipes]|nr:transposable element Tcb2 transposase [Trichonephila clavipes]